MADKNPNTGSDSENDPQVSAEEVSEHSPSNGDLASEDRVASEEDVEFEQGEENAEEEKNKAIQEKLLRTAAELDNVRKRARRDVEDAKVFGRTEILRDILPVIDSLDLALNTVDPDGPASAIVEGVVMVRKQFLNATERYDLKPIDSVQKAFDPNYHEAVAQVFSEELEAGQIVEESARVICSVTGF